jgi:hypothetical protein
MGWRLLTAAVVLGMAVGCSQPAAPKTPPVKGTGPMGEVKQENAEKSDNTTADPLRWEAVPCDEGYEFRDRTLPEQIIVTVLEHKRDLTAEELEETVTRLVALRRSAIAQLSAGKAVLGETVFKRSNSEVEARVVGEDAPNKVRLAFVIRGTPKKTLIVAFTRYTLDEVGVPFAEYVGVIFDLFKIKNG